MATMPPAEICSCPSAGSRLARPAFNSSPHTWWILLGIEEDRQPAVGVLGGLAVTLLPIRLAHQIGMSARTGWLISFSGLPSPVPCPAG